MSWEIIAQLVIWNGIAGEAIPVDVACYMKSDGKLWMVDDTSRPPLFRTRTAAAAAGDRIDVAVVAPIVSVVLGGTVTVGAWMACSTAGVVIAATSDNVWVDSQALVAGAIGETIPAVWYPHVTNDVSALSSD